MIVTKTLSIDYLIDIVSSEKQLQAQLQEDMLRTFVLLAPKKMHWTQQKLPDCIQIKAELAFTSPKEYEEAKTFAADRNKLVTWLTTEYRNLNQCIEQLTDLDPAGIAALKREMVWYNNVAKIIGIDLEQWLKAEAKRNKKLDRNDKKHPLKGLVQDENGDWFDKDGALVYEAGDVDDFDDVEDVIYTEAEDNDLAKQLSEESKEAEKQALKEDEAEAEEVVRKPAKTKPYTKSKRSGISDESWDCDEVDED